MKWRLFLLVALVAIAALLLSRPRFRAGARAAWQRLGPRVTVEDRLRQYGDAARARWRPYFERAGLAYPPTQVVLVGIKDADELRVYAAGGNAKFQFVRRCRVLAASGGLGPKLREGDHQVPEGIYPIESLNPNSSFHLSLRVGYPNAFDRDQAAREGRTDLGGDIMIHGSAVSIGCLAMGDEVAEDLFVLAADTGLKNLSVILSPVDFRLGRTVPPGVKRPPWTDTLYSEIRGRLQGLPLADSQ
jgi:hypothetical protein